MVVIRKNLCRTFLILLAATSAFFTSAYAWHPVLSVGGGMSTSSTVGNSTTFPIQNATTDEFYAYSVNHSTQTSSLLDSFLGIEWHVRPNWMMQMGINYNQASPFSARGPFLQGADAGSADAYMYHYRVLTRQLLLEGKLLYTLKNRYHPYLLAGLGAAFNKAYNFYTSVPPTLTFTRMYANNATTSFSYAIGVGIDTDIASQLRLGIGYRFANVGQIKLGGATIDTINVYGTLSQSNWYANELILQLTWRVC